LGGKLEALREGKCVQVPGLEEFIADFGSEASVVASPYPSKVDNEPTQEVVVSSDPGEVGSEHAQEVSTIVDIEEEEEEEDENYDTHFKQKNKSPTSVAYSLLSERRGSILLSPQAGIDGLFKLGRLMHQRFMPLLLLLRFFHWLCQLMFFLQLRQCCFCSATDFSGSFSGPTSGCSGSSTDCSSGCANCWYSSVQFVPVIDKISFFI